MSRLLARRTGHFRLESGHHGELWLDLERLCLRPEPVRWLAGELARRLARQRIDAVCGPLVEGAFVALFAAEALGVPFTYSERVAEPPSESLFAARYLVPRPLHGELAGKRVAIVNDVINAAELAAGAGVALESLAEFPNAIWEPRGCPLCARGVELE